LLLICVGIGLQFVPLTAVRRVHPSETGLASALLSTSQQVGGAFGLSLLVTVAIDAAKAGHRASPPQPTGMRPR
jgi:hypothetical protein